MTASGAHEDEEERDEPVVATRDRAARLLRRLGLAALVTVLVASLLGSARIVVIAVSPPPAGNEALVEAQTAWLWKTIGDGAASDMQALFPEGFLFTVVLTGLAIAAGEPSAPDADPVSVDQVRELLAMAHSAEGTAPFDPGATPELGVFHAGWTLLLAVELARLSGSPADADDVEQQASAIRDAFESSATGLLEAYPGQTWPCDSTVAVAALRRADDLVGVPGTAATVERWLGQMDEIRSPDSGLLPHRTSPTGQLLVEPRATSQAIIQAFWPDIEPVESGSDGGWATFVETFVDRRLGLVGALEYPAAEGGPADVDSGPLVLGMSASSTVVTLAAARRHGARELADALDREIELVGAGLTWNGRRRYAAGALPVGDAFLAWAGTRPLPNQNEPPAAGLALEDGPQWWLFLTAAALPGAVAASALWWRHRCGRPARCQQFA